jgi:hypothetical protein
MRVLGNTAVVDGNRKIVAKWQAGYHKLAGKA